MTDPNVLYFAYGSNMSSGRLRATRCPTARSLGRARLDGHRLVFSKPTRTWGGHAAGIEPAPGDEVWGVLWELTAAEWARLLADEQGYEARPVTVAGDDGAQHMAWTFFVLAPEPGLPSPKYRDVLLAGAIEHGLPAGYIERLRGFATAKPAD